MRRRTPDENHGPPGRRPRQAGENHHQRQSGAVLAGPRQTPIQDTTTKCVVGLGLHLCRLRRTSRSNTPNTWPRLGSNHQQAASATATTETINGLYKAEVIHRRGPWRSFGAVEFATLEWVDWSTIAGYWSPSATYLRPKPKTATTPCANGQPWWRDSNQTASGKPGVVRLIRPRSNVITLDTDDRGIASPVHVRHALRPPSCSIRWTDVEPIDWRQRWPSRCFVQPQFLAVRSDLYQSPFSAAGMRAGLA